MRVQTGEISFPAGAEIGPHLRVKISAGTVVLSDGATDVDLGVLRYRVQSGEMAAVVPYNSTGSIRCVAAGSITEGAAVYGAANGQVGTGVNANPVGLALHAASAGEYVEVVPKAYLPVT